MIVLFLHFYLARFFSFFRHHISRHLHICITKPEFHSANILTYTASILNERMSVFRWSCCWYVLVCASLMMDSISSVEKMSRFVAVVAVVAGVVDNVDDGDVAVDKVHDSI